jgi:hypothetical protein
MNNKNTIIKLTAKEAQYIRDVLNGVSHLIDEYIVDGSNYTEEEMNEAREALMKLP